jgi:hypothetical protein
MRGRMVLVGEPPNQGMETDAQQLTLRFSFRRGSCPALSSN